MKSYLKGYQEEGTIKKLINQNDGRIKIYIEVEEHEDAYFYVSRSELNNYSEGDKVKFTSKETGEQVEVENVIKISSGSNMRNNNHNSSRLLPKDTTNAIGNSKVENFYLNFSKYFKFDNNNKTIFPKRSEEIPFNNESYYSGIEKLNLSAKTNFELQNSWRMMVGMGNESVYEVSLTLHHIYGVPYIPGQALKGITRSLFIQKKLPSNFKYGQKDAGKKLDEYFIENFEDYREIFGNSKTEKFKKEQSGKVIFFDAFPTQNIHIEKDIMTPHYGPYYADTTNKIPPADYFNPTPIEFLTVANTTFKFVIGVKPSVKKEKADELIKETEELLKEALKEHGVGAKTAVGYGRFE